jgi:hypothetical protein
MSQCAGFRPRRRLFSPHGASRIPSGTRRRGRLYLKGIEAPVSSLDAAAPCRSRRASGSS